MRVDRRCGAPGQVHDDVAFKDRGSPVPSRNLLLRSLGPAVEDLGLHLSLVSFKAGQVIKHECEANDLVYFPIQGLISSRMAFRSGHEIECSLIGKTNALGALSALGLHHGSTHFLCLTDGQAWTMTLSHLVAAVRTQPMVERQIKLFAFAQMGYAVRVGVCNAMHTAEQRLARWLATAAELLGQCEIRLAQEELSSSLGLQRSCVSPALQKLKAEGMVDVARGRIFILDPDRLSRRACECGPMLRRALGLDDGFDGTAAMGSFGQR